MKIIRRKFNKNLKKLIKNLDDLCDKYQSVEIDWYDRFSEESYIYLLMHEAEIVGYAYASPITKKLYDQLEQQAILTK